MASVARAVTAVHRALGIVVGAERRRGRLDLAAFVEDLDAPLGFLEPRVAEARQLHAALEERERFSSARSPSSSFLTMVSSSAIADSKSLMMFMVITDSARARRPEILSVRHVAIVGARILPLPGSHGRDRQAAHDAALRSDRASGQHSSRPRIRAQARRAGSDSRGGRPGRQARLARCRRAVRPLPQPRPRASDSRDRIPARCRPRSRASSRSRSCEAAARVGRRRPRRSPKLIGQFRGMSSAHREPGVPARQPAPADERMHAAAAAAHSARAAEPAALEARHPRAELVLCRDDQLRRRRGRRRPQIGDEVGDGEVALRVRPRRSRAQAKPQSRARPAPH